MGGFLLVGGIVFIVGAVIALSVFLYFKIKVRRLLDDAGYEGQSIGDIIRQARLEDEQTPKSLASMDRIYLKEIKKDFKEININELKRQAEEVLLNCYNAVELKNSDKLKGKVKSFVDSIISDYEGKNVKFNDFKIHNTVVSNYKKEKGTASIYLSTAYEYKLNIDGEQKKKVQDRVKTEFIYVIDEKKLDGNDIAIGIHCPNCNSPITSLGDKSCSYCGSAVILVVGKIFACNDIVRY